MPPVPAHNRAWRGSPVMLEVQREGTNRLRVHSHDNEYIGLLRERIARHMACSAKNVRMICMGELPLAMYVRFVLVLLACWRIVAGVGLRSAATGLALDRDVDQPALEGSGGKLQRTAKTGCRQALAAATPLGLFAPATVPPVSNSKMDAVPQGAP